MQLKVSVSTFILTVLVLTSSPSTAERSEIHETINRKGLGAFLANQTDLLEQWPHLPRINPVAIKASSPEAIANKVFLTDTLEGIKAMKPAVKGIAEATLENLCLTAAKVGEAARAASGASNLMLSDSLNRLALGACARFLILNPEKYDVVETLIGSLQVEELKREKLTDIVKEFPLGYFKRDLSEFSQKHTIEGICAAMEGRNEQGMGYLMSDAFKSSRMIDDLELEALALRMKETNRFLDYGLIPLIELAKRGATLKAGTNPFEVVANDQEFWKEFPTLDHTPPKAIIEVFSRDNWQEDRFVSIAVE